MRTTSLSTFNFRLCFLHTQQRNQQPQIEFSQLDERTERSILISGLIVNTERPEPSLFPCSQKNENQGNSKQIIFFSLLLFYFFLIKYIFFEKRLSLEGVRKGFVGGYKGKEE